MLLDQRGRSLAVIEAKKNAIDPYTASPTLCPKSKSFLYFLDQLHLVMCCRIRSPILYSKERDS
jgi:hypothetical protein